MKIAAAYLRVSTERQDEYSLDSQLKLIRDYAAANDYIVPDEFVFIDDGISGRSAEKRPEFLRMIGTAKEKEPPFEAILVWKFSRFARNQEESIVYKSMLARCGVTVVSISEPLAEGAFGSLIERILEWMDEFYSIRLSGEVRRGMTERVSRGEPVTIPSFGYDITDKTYVPNSDADTVRRIYADYLAGKGVSTIARELALEGVKTRRGKSPENRWVQYILENPVYIGKLRWSPDGKANYTRSEVGDSAMLVDGTHEHIIDDATWAAVQNKIARSKRGRIPYQRREQPVDWMLKGLVRCDTCGSTLVYTSTACPSMQCHKYAHGACPTSHALSIAKANRAVIAALESCAASMSFPIAPQTVKPTADEPDYNKLIKQERQKLRRLMDAYEEGVYTIEEFAERRAKLDNKIAQLQKQAEKSTPAIVDVQEYKERVLGVLKVLKSDSVSESEKNEVLKSIISYIVYEKANNRLALYFYM